MDANGFAFVTVQPGFERAAKIEIARDHPQWRLAYGRPGVLTFKTPLVPGPRAPSTFARVWGVSLGHATSAEEAIALASLREHQRWHVFPRDPEDEGLRAVAELWRARIAEVVPSVQVAAELGDEVIDVIVDGPESVLVGFHRHARWRAAEPGGQILMRELPDAPSRAWAKLEQAVAWGGLELQPGERVLDIGAAPGGAMAALLHRGLHVWAVDPGALDPNIDTFATQGSATWRHLQVPLSEVRWEDLTVPFDWLLCDVHLAPQVALHQIARIVPPLRRSLRGAIITLKLNDWSFVEEIPKWRDRVGQMGFGEVHSCHLPAHRKEIGVVARMRG